MTTSTMKRLLLVAALLAIGIACADASKASKTLATATRAAGDLVRLQGAGASFPAPLYLKWFKTFSARKANLQVDYQSVGSGSGVKSFIDETVDFGASDAAMTRDDIARVDRGAQMVPMTAGSIVLAFNLGSTRSPGSSTRSSSC